VDWILRYDRGPDWLRFRQKTRLVRFAEKQPNKWALQRYVEARWEMMDA